MNWIAGQPAHDAPAAGRARHGELQWGSEALKARAKTEDEVAFLPSGRFLDMECSVRYGIIGKPVPIKKAKDGQ